MATNHQLEPADKLFPKSARIILDNLPLYISLFAVSAIFTIWDIIKSYSHGWTNVFSNVALAPGTGDAPDSVKGGAFLVTLLVSLIVSLLLTIAFLRTAQGKKPAFVDVWEEFKAKGLRLFGLEIALAILILVGLILIIVPGIILIWRLFLAPYILLDEDIGITDAIKKSWRMTVNYGWPIYGVLILNFIFGITAIIPVIGIIVAFILTTLYSVAPALRYVEIKNRT